MLADRAFTLQDELAAYSGVKLHIPSFTKGRQQIPAAEVESSRMLAQIRIHIERVIGHLRNVYTILKRTIPLRMVKSLRNETQDEDMTNIDKIVRACAILINLRPSIVSRKYVEIAINSFANTDSYGQFAIFHLVCSRVRIII